MKKRLLLFGFPAMLVFCVSAESAFSWMDETHLALSKAAGYRQWYNSAGADVTKTKARKIEDSNHYSNLPLEFSVSARDVLEQTARYDWPGDREGHLYGAIIASVREYRRIKGKDPDKYAGYHLAFFAHYVEDLSQPLHSMPYDEFNKNRHLTNDGIVAKEALRNVKKIKQKMYEIKINGADFENDLSKEVARIANLARELGKKLKKENRDMTKEEVYTQLGHSASLLKAVLTVLDLTLVKD